MNLVIDIGNSSAKVFVFEGETLLWSSVLRAWGIDEMAGVFVSFPRIKNCIVSSVVHLDKGLLEFLRKHCTFFLELESDTPMPLQNCYHSPLTLGKDRLAAAVGAWKMFPGRALLVVDLGTAITYDLVSARGEYLGGNIAPGMSMRFRALHEFTAKLPLVAPSEDQNWYGKDTQQAINLGVTRGIECELMGYIAKFSDSYESLTVLLTGGDAFFFAQKLKNSIFAPILVAEGLNTILRLNYENTHI